MRSKPVYQSRCQGGRSPFIHLRACGDTVRCAGSPSFRAGHRLPGGDGIFAFWDWNGTTLTAGVDRYGFRNLYYFRREGEIAISPSLTELLKLGASPEFDDAALAVFLRLETFLGEETPFASIRALPPNAALRWTRDSFSLAGGPVVPKPLSISRDEAIDRYIDLFAAAVRRRIHCPGPLAVTLSGGRDSRHILLELCRQGRRPDCSLTVDFGFTTDARVAKELVRRCGIPQFVAPDPAISLENELRSNIATNFCFREAGWFLAIQEHLRGRAASIWDGIAGDILSAGLFLTPERIRLADQGRFEELAENLLETPAGDDPLERVLQPKMHRRWNRQTAVSRTAAALEQFADSGNPVGLFFFWHRTRRQIAQQPFAIGVHAADVYAPFVDHALYDFLASLPMQLLEDHSFHTAAIARAYPEFNNVPYSRRISSQRYGRAALVRLTRNLANFAWRRRGTDILSRAFLTPRLLRCMVDPSYARTAAWMAPLAIYLLQIESLERNP